MMRPTIGLVFLVAALVPVASAQQAVEFEGAQSWHAQTYTSDEAGTFHYEVGFQVNETRTGYLKVLPTPWNPAFRNGSVNQSGWWTELSWLGPNESTPFAWSNGSVNMELGELEAGKRYQLRVSVHAPAGALSQPMEYRLSYSLAVRPVAASSGSGGTFDQSVSVLPRLAVVAPIQQAQGEAPEAGLNPLAWVGIGLVLLVAAIIVVFVVRNARRRKEQA